MRQKQAMNSLTASQSVNGASRTVRVGESLRLVNGRAFKPTEWKKSGLPIVRIQNLNNPDAPFNYYEGQLPEKFLLDDGDLLFAWSGTPGTSFGAHIWRRGRAWLNQHIFKVHFDDKQFDKRYLQLAINRNLEQYIRAAHGGAGLAHITKGRFEESTLPCLPLDEQQRIVAEIEKQFTRLDAGMASLKRVQIALKRYRASVLKAACEGRLVPIEAELARKENHSYETGEELLRRILEERRKKWKGKGKYKEPATPAIVGLLTLPEGWTWAGLDQLMLNITDGDHQPPPQTNSGVPFLVIRDVRSGKLDFGDTRFVSREYANQVEPFRKPAGGDILYTLVGSYGIALRVTTDQEFCIQRHIGVLRPHALSPADYLAHVLNSSFVFRQAGKVATGTAQMTVPLAGLRRIVIPLPPIHEQERIVAEIERRLSVTEQLEATIHSSLGRANRLREATLHQAFSSDLQ